MHLSRLFSVTLVVGIAAGATILACGSSNNPTSVDAKVFRDAGGSVLIDGPGSGSATLTGLGEKCGTGGVATCPSNASQCIGLSGTTSYCTPLCDMNGSGTTNGSAQLPLGSVIPAPTPATCTGAFTGSAGSAACNLILAIVPADNPLQANKAYTGISLACSIVCGAGNACPAGMTCNTSAMLCLPN